MNLTKKTQKQMTLAMTARDNPEHRFTNLYSLMHWDYWIECAAPQSWHAPAVQRRAWMGKHAMLSWPTTPTNQHLTPRAKAENVPATTSTENVYPEERRTKRPLGIPALRDRIVQEALRAILDPIYESDFWAHSYGFRKGRSTMDAIAVAMSHINNGTYCYVIEGDIKSYFDNVHHRKLLSILKKRIADKDIITLIWKFLKAGVMEGGLFAHTETGVPQGGIISPLLANIYLNEFDQWVAQRWYLTPYAQRKRRNAGWATIEWSGLPMIG